MAAFSSSGRGRSIEPISLGAGAHADHDQAPVGGERLQIALEVGRADELEDHVERPRIGEILGIHDIGPEGRDAVAHLRAPDGGRHGGTRGSAELDRRGTDATGPAVDEQALARLQAGLGEQGVVRRREHLGKPPGLGPVQAAGDRHRHALVDDRQLGLAAAADDRAHPVAVLESLGSGAAREHLAGPGMSGGDPGGAG